ncbi:putative enoyl-CoA hydratase [Frankia canadensis]|uniref:enoyl-CoA hydratase n=1 Tax=Frankia canadensis TaxID=1836972 RepID=A0A2I2KHV7_9ACTN|nr:acetyl-CoA acetyltransferase [Frankia canadensis]SNQ45246.1 putative enoyl-CoA hydratase [Frankia canadensis]SOU52536.1 putative enoyl-CoA hydratase [Frankia canadensis]
MVNLDDLDPATPVLVGAGQYAERLDEPGYARMSPVDLAAAAARRALEDAGIDPTVIDTVAGVRQFEISAPDARAPLGRSDNYPRAVARRIGADPRRAVLEVSGGQGPQHLVNEFSAVVASGGAEVVLLLGSEAISTARALALTEDRPDFTEHVGGDLEDRGYGLQGLVTRYFQQHQLTGAPRQYALFENARRARLKLSRTAYARAMGRLFEPFTRVAATNRFAAAPVERNPAELVTPTVRNRIIADPYTRFLIARDQVNQGAAVLLTSVAAARRLDVPEQKWVFLHGHADLRERDLLDRADLTTSPAAVMAVQHALDVAGLTLEQISTFDLYSCFPIAVFNICDGLGLSPDDPRGLTLTGGLPFFGGAGNNYSMHAIAETVRAMRASPGTYGLVGANGGALSKYSVGIYSTAPTPWRLDDSGRLQAEIDAWDPAPVAYHADGWATIETFTVGHDRADAPVGIVVGRLERDGRRFLATAVAGDEEMLALLGDEQPIGERIFARAFGNGNRVATSPAAMDRLVPRRAPVLRDDFEHVLVHRDGHVLEITINRPQVRNALHPPASRELDEVFDAYFADADLWVAILTGAGDQAFSAGNDLVWSARGEAVSLPRSGFAGLTSRRDMTKPVIAAVNGYAMGGGCEIALACHLVVADETATFALSEARVGLIAGAGGLVRLPRTIPIKIATEMITTGRRMPAAEALSHGLVNRVVPAGTALQGARTLAADILASSPTSVHASLQVMNETAGIADPHDAVQHVSRARDAVLLSDDMREGLAAFAQKRSPRWRNR